MRWAVIVTARMTLHSTCKDWHQLELFQKNGLRNHNAQITMVVKDAFCFPASHGVRMVRTPVCHSLHTVCLFFLMIMREGLR